MKRKLLADALSEVSEQHVAEAANIRRRPIRWIGLIAAILAVALGIGIFSKPFVQADAVSLAEYPEFRWVYREHMEETVNDLSGFFMDSISGTLSSHEGKNAAFSPANLYMALSVAAELTGGSSRQQLLDALGASDLLTHRSQTAEFWNACYLDNEDKTLLANSLWLDEALSYQKDTMDILADHYYTSVYREDLDSPATAQGISNWVNQQTGGLLKEFADRIQLPAETVLALYSTVFYRAKWTLYSEFSPALTSDGIFHSPDGKSVCSFMHHKEYQTNYYWGDSFGAVSLPLKDGSRMWFILPDEERTIEEVLADEALPSTLFRHPSDSEGGKYLKVNLTVPKFDIQVQGDLMNVLQGMGITDMFSPDSADFSPSVAADIPIWFTAVNQATRVAIDEEGVTAASYIELPAAGEAMPPEEIIDFILDRPFLFVISNRYSIPLFAGVVNKP